MGCSAMNRVATYLTITIGTALCLSPAALAGEGVPSATELLTKMQAFDSVLSKGFSCKGTETGSFSVGVRPFKMNWELTCGDQGTAMVFRSAEVPAIEYQQLETSGLRVMLPTRSFSVGVLSEHILFFGKEYSSQHRVDTIFQVSPDNTKRELGKARVVQLRPPDAPEMTLPIMKAFLSLGRMYTEYLDEVTAVAKDDDGLLHVTAKGHIDMGNTGTWHLIVEPGTAYLVRKASYLPEGREGEKPLLEIENSGVKYSGGVCTAEASSWRQTFPDPNSEPHRLVFESTSQEVSNDLLVEATKAMNGPFPPNTVFMDDRAVPPIIETTPSLFGPGEAVPPVETILAEMTGEEVQDMNVEAQLTSARNGHPPGPDTGQSELQPRTMRRPVPAEARNQASGRLYAILGLVVVGAAVTGYFLARVRKKKC